MPPERWRINRLSWDESGVREGGGLNFDHVTLYPKDASVHFDDASLYLRAVFAIVIGGMVVLMGAAPIWDVRLAFLMPEAPTLVSEVAILKGEAVTWKTQVSFLIVLMVIGMPEVVIGTSEVANLIGYS